MKGNIDSAIKENYMFSYVVSNSSALILDKNLIEKIGVINTIYLQGLINRYRYCQNNNLLNNSNEFEYTQKEIEDDLTLNFSSQKRCLSFLKKIKIVEAIKKGKRYQNYFKLNANYFSQLYYLIDLKTIKKNKKNHMQKGNKWLETIIVSLYQQTIIDPLYYINLDYKFINYKDKDNKDSQTIIVSPKEKDKNKELYQKIINYLNKKSNTNFRLTPNIINLINTLFKNKYSKEDIKKVLNKKINDEWFVNHGFYRPTTLFRLDKFDIYLNEKIKNSSLSINQEKKLRNDYVDRTDEEEYYHELKDLEKTISNDLYNYELPCIKDIFEKIINYYNTGELSKEFNHLDKKTFDEYLEFKLFKKVNNKCIINKNYDEYIKNKYNARKEELKKKFNIEE